MWQSARMSGGRHDRRMHRRLIDSLYVEAMLLADEARSYFDEAGRAEREALDPLSRVGFSLRIAEGDDAADARHRLAADPARGRCRRAARRATRSIPSRRLGDAPVTDARCWSARCPTARAALIAASTDLHRRVARLDARAGSGRRARQPGAVDAGPAGAGVLSVRSAATLLAQAGVER